MKAKRPTSIEQAKEYVVSQVRLSYNDARKNAALNGFGRAYRDEIRRLWHAALKAVSK